MARPSNKLFTLILNVILMLPCLMVNADEGQQRIEQDARLSLDQAPSHTLEGWLSRIGIQYGGWLNYRFNDYNESDNDRSLKDALNTISVVDARYWLKFTLRPEEGSTDTNEHSIYLRLKDQYINRTGVAPGARYDLDGPHVDYVYTLLDYRPFWVEAGRRYFNVGKGIIYSNIHDGFQLNYRIPGFNVGLFASKTLPHESNIDTSVPGYDKDSERYFYGLGLGFTGIKDQSIYGFFMAQKDLSDRHEDSVNHNFIYDSQYIGIGSKGKVVSSLEYWLELIKEQGTSRIYTSNERKNVNAWAMDAEIAYVPKITTHPRLSLEYALGSGDEDRTSVTDTQFGNTSGQDKNFLYFGYVPTGFALAPRLSNLQMIRTGFELSPFERTDTLKKLSCGINFYQFFKHVSAGGISDSEAAQNSKGIGREYDLYVDWRIFSDLSFSLEYGHFMPGKAYSDTTNTAENFLSFSVTHIF